MKSKNKKIVLGAFNGSFLSNLVKGVIAFLISFKGTYEKSLGNPDL